MNFKFTNSFPSNLASSGNGYLSTMLQQPQLFFGATRWRMETRPSPEVVFEGGPDLFAHSVLGPHIKNIRGRKGRPKRAFKEVFCEIICASKSTSSQGQLATRSRPIVHCTHCGVTGREIKGDPRFLSSSTLSPSPSSECVFTVRAKPNTKGLFHSLMRFYCNSDSSG